MSLASPILERENGHGVQKECAQWITLADVWLEKLFCGSREELNESAVR